MSDKTNFLGRAWRRAMGGVGKAAMRAAGITTSEELARAMGMSLESTAGPVVTPSTALTLSTVYACVRNLAEDIATLPVGLFRRTKDDGKEPVLGDPVAALLRKPNAWQTRAAFLRFYLGQRALNGNALAEKNIVRGRVAELLPEAWPGVTVAPNRFREPVYTVPNPDGGLRTLRFDQVVHAMGFSVDGYQGLSPIQVARDDMGLGMAARRHASKVFKTGGTSRVVIEHPKTFGFGKDGEKAAESFLKGIEQRWGGEKSANIIVLEEGMTAKTVSLSPEDLQFLQSREFQVEEICRWWRMPPHMVQHLARSTNNNIEQQSLEYLIFCLRPFIVDVEQTFNRALLGDRDDLFVEFNINGLLRGNLKDRFAAYAAGRQWGWLSVNDIRRWENMNGIGAEGDIYLQAVNMIEAGKTIGKDQEAAARAGLALMAGNKPEDTEVNA